MFTATKLSKVAISILIICIVGAVVLSVSDGVLRGNLPRGSQVVVVWVSDFRYLFEQGICASTIFWAAARFIEAQTILSVGFDRLDAATMSVKGPDETNTVWIGRRYGARLEAEAVVAAFEVRIQEAQGFSSNE